MRSPLTLAQSVLHQFWHFKSWKNNISFIKRDITSEIHSSTSGFYARYGFSPKNDTPLPKYNLLHDMSSCNKIPSELCFLYTLVRTTAVEELICLFILQGAIIQKNSQHKLQFYATKCSTSKQTKVSDYMSCDGYYSLSCKNKDHIHRVSRN